MKRWYAIQTRPRNERRALGHLSRQGFESYLPEYTRTRRHARRTEVVSAPLFPGYFFIFLDLAVDSWSRVNNTRGVVGLVRSGSCPISLPEGFVTDLIDREDKYGLHTHAAMSGYRAGQRVRIIGGVLDDMEGKFHALSDDVRVTVLLALLGKTVRVDLPASRVEAA